jgi:hypothetical protein
MSWPTARNVLVADAEAGTAGETDGAAAGTEGDPARLAGAAALLAGLEAGAAAELVAGAAAELVAGAAAELVAELQAVSSKVAPASSTPAASGRPLRACVVNINSPTR